MTSYWLITENDRVGTASEEPSALPEGWKAIEVGEDQLNQPENFYIQDWEIKEKPPKPAPNSLWVNNEWIEMLPNTVSSVPTNLPDYLSFRMAMLRDSGYDRVTLASNVLRVTRLETAVAQNPPELPVVAAMWEAIIQELTEKPKAAEIESWNTIASDNNVPLKFDKDGKMILD
jgi:hypothetical protein